MTDLHNVKDYKFAKVVVGDLEIILKIINLAIKGLEPFKPYSSVQNILEILRGEKRSLEIHYEKYKKVKKEKGKVK